MSHPLPTTDRALWNTQSDKFAGNSGRTGPRRRRGLASPARRVPALQIRPASRPPRGARWRLNGRPPRLVTCWANVPATPRRLKVAGGERGYGPITAAIISRSPTARHPQGDQPPFDPSIRSPGDERNLLPKAALRVVAADRTHRLR